MWKKAVGILLAASVAGSFFYYGLTHAYAADNDWTIGIPRVVNHAFMCESEQAAVTFAKMIHEQTFEEVTNNPTAVAYVSEGICGDTGGLRVEPLSVAYHDTMKDDPNLVIKVVRATPTPEKPDPKTTMYFIVSNTIIGSGIEEHVGTPS